MPFNLYWILLIVSGVLMMGMAATGYGQRTPGRRVWTGVLGLGFAVYGLYLGFIFNGDSYYIFFYAFAVPILLVVNAAKENTRIQQRKQAPQRAPQYPPVPFAPQAPQGQMQPGQMQPAPAQQPVQPAEQQAQQPSA